MVAAPVPLAQVVVTLTSSVAVARLVEMEMGAVIAFLGMLVGSPMKLMAVMGKPYVKGLVNAESPTGVNLVERGAGVTRTRGRKRDGEHRRAAVGACASAIHLHKLSSMRSQLVTRQLVSSRLRPVSAAVCGRRTDQWHANAVPRTTSGRRALRHCQLRATGWLG